MFARGNCLICSAIHSRVITSSPLSTLRRTYALSRFPDRQPGTRRSRSPPTRGRKPNRQQKFIQEESNNYEQASFPDESSPLRIESFRRPAIDPMAGLRKLLMENEELVITRQIEMLNIFLGFEQMNRYVISDETGAPLGYIAEEPRGLLSAFSRQIFRTHRPFRALIMDTAGSPILWIRRPFAWINSRMFVQHLKDYASSPPDAEPVLETFAEVQQRWHLWRRRYDLFLRDQDPSAHRARLTLSSSGELRKKHKPKEEEVYRQFARVDEGLWAWDFTLVDGRGEEIASVHRQFRGFGREIFTDTGQYFVRFSPYLHEPDRQVVQALGTPYVEPPPRFSSPKPTVVRELNLEERALVLALAVNIDFDYFSRHSEGGGGGFFWFPHWTWE